MNELSRHIEILLLDNDCVIVPGFGGFMAHHSPAEWDKETGMFYPPQRTLGFNSQLTLNDSLLAQSYVEAYDISYPEAVQRIEEEVGAIKQNIVICGAYEFHGIGTVTLGSNGIYDFEPCTAGLLTPELYALNSFAFDELTVEDDKEEEQNVANKSLAKKSKTLRIAAYNTARYIAAAAIIMFLFVFSSIPVGVGSNKVITCSVIDTEFLASFIKSNSILGDIDSNSKADANVTLADVKADSLNSKVIEGKAADSTTEGRYHIVLASKIAKEGAEQFVAQLNGKGLTEARVYEKSSMRRVVYGVYETKDDADSALNELKRQHADFCEAWVNAEK